MLLSRRLLMVAPCVPCTANGSLIQRQVAIHEQTVALVHLYVSSQQILHFHKQDEPSFDYACRQFSSSQTVPHRLQALPTRLGTDGAFAADKQL